MDKVLRFEFRPDSGYGCCDANVVDSGEYVAYEDYDVAITVLRNLLDRFMTASGYELHDHGTLAYWSDNGDFDAAAILAARVVLSRAP